MLTIAVVVAVLILASIVYALASRPRKHLPRELQLVLWVGESLSEKQQMQITDDLQVLLDMAQAICKGPGEDRPPRLRPLLYHDAPGIVNVVLELALVDHFDEEIAAMLPTIERTKERIATVLGIDTNSIEFRFDQGPDGMPAPPGPCLNGGPRFEEVFPRASRATPLRR